MTDGASRGRRRGAPFWDQFWRATGTDAARRTTLAISARLAAEALAREWVPGTSLRVLDLGCGRGEIARMLVRRLAVKVVGADFSWQALRDALWHEPADRAAGRIRYVGADCYRLGFADASFDAVISFGYASAASYQGAESEVARVLRPGGLALIDFPNLSIYNTLLRPRSLLRLFRRYRGPGKVYHFGTLGLREHFAPYGLTLEGVRYFNTYPPLGDRLSPSTYLRLERFGQLIGAPVARVLLAEFRKSGNPSSCK